MRIAVINPPWYYWTNKSNGKNMPANWLPFKDKKGYYAGKYEKRCGIRAGSRWAHTIQQQAGYKIFPMNLAYVTSLLKQDGHDVMLIDSITARHTYTQFYNIIKDFNPDTIVCEIGAACEDNDMTILRNLQKMIPDAKVIITGCNATINAERLIENKFVSAICKGDYVKSVQHVIDEEIDGIIDPIEYNLDDLPYPYRDDDLLWMIEEKTHGEYGITSQTGRKINLISSRGCPFSCAFCDIHVMYPNIKERSLESIEAEVKYLVEKYGKEVFLFFDDDTFNYNRKRTLAIGEIMGKYEIPWSFLGRIDTLKEGDWDDLIKNGLTSLNVGIESGSQRILDAMGKNLDVKKAKRFIKYLIERGVYVNVALVYDFKMGDVQETPEEKEMTSKLIEELGINNRTRSTAVPLPGSKMWDQLEDKNVNLDGFKVDASTELVGLKKVE